MNTMEFETVVLSDKSPVKGIEYSYSVDYYHDCPTCESAKAKGVMPFVKHMNCMYIGSNAIGHKKERGHCTADSCY